MNNSISIFSICMLLALTVCRGAELQGENGPIQAEVEGELVVCDQGIVLRRPWVHTQYELARFADLKNVIKNSIKQLCKDPAKAQVAINYFVMPDALFDATHDSHALLEFCTTQQQKIALLRAKAKKNEITSLEKLQLQGLIAQWAEYDAYAQCKFE